MVGAHPLSSLPLTAVSLCLHRSEEVADGGPRQEGLQPPRVGAQLVTSAGEAEVTVSLAADGGVGGGQQASALV